MCRPPSSGRVRGRACGLPYPESGWRSRPSVTMHVCFLTGAPRRQRPGRCSPFHAPIPPRPAVSDGRGEAVIPRPIVRGPMAVVLPRSPSPLAVLGAPLPAMLIVCRRRWGPVIGRERRRVRPVIAHPPSRSRRRSNSNHAGKSTYSGEIDYRFLTFQTGSRI